MLKIKDKAPEFSIPDQKGELITLKDFNGKWVVLYFYPKDDTPGCTMEAIEFTTLKQEFKRLNTEVLGVSKDSQKSHCSFIKKQDLKLILLSDEEKILAQAYGAWGKKKFMGREYMGMNRTTYLINPKGKLAFIWENVKAKGHAQIVLKKVKELQL
ncbi:thioredoxin-dependent thiol peroxidase [Candidatus Woesearchaeota archaeon CG10_big_fil_rev_8_21_14_0_10_32_24]|nr:MAG: thioredoxin-dependent thiol peroxidase [Candidatus Woesearchaeota archaeon CG10_big_fil_rev_8_21_14_0_10_32_24]